MREAGARQDRACGGVQAGGGGGPAAEDAVGEDPAGDAASNAIIAKALPQLPLKWDAANVAVGSQSADAKSHVPILIYPNPLDKAGPGAAPHYLVLNSGPTFRENDDRNNSQQNPKLPDWAIIDVTVTPDDKTPGGITAADFFDEAWQVQAKHD